ncbi:hypothetical protein [Chromobacterium violaceum]|uniref:hypothetical protein n=1 Tax=Chromobacterium violaceum TaxID=536 RepID=UPI00143DFAE1|nr:hypothetical protein [Chromobacterium violaceum]QIY77708.1 hypothetical protein FOB43_00155 [Chromobacterium violaceum]
MKLTVKHIGKDSGNKPTAAANSVIGKSWAEGMKTIVKGGELAEEGMTAAVSSMDLVHRELFVSRDMAEARKVNAKQYRDNAQVKKRDPPKVQNANNAHAANYFKRFAEWEANPKGRAPVKELGYMLEDHATGYVLSRAKTVLGSAGTIKPQFVSGGARPDLAVLTNAAIIPGNPTAGYWIGLWDFTTESEGLPHIEQKYNVMAPADQNKTAYMGVVTYSSALYNRLGVGKLVLDRLTKAKLRRKADRLKRELQQAKDRKASLRKKKV